MKNIKNIGLGILLGTIALFLVIAFTQTGTALGSVQDGQGYMATSTSADSGSGASLIRTGQGMLGSVVITFGSTAPLKVYNATTTNILARTGNTSTSSITIANFPTTATAGTYTFDVQFTTGLLIETTSAVGIASSTITYK